jgi:tight adherence protein B
MIAGAVAGGVLAAWLVARIAERSRVHRVRRRLAGVARAVRPAPPSRALAGSASPADAPPRRTDRAAFGLAPGRRWRLLLGHRFGRGPQSIDEDGRLAETCDSIARALRGGRSLAAAITEAADRHGHPAVVEIGRGIGVGEQVPTAIDRVAGRADDPDTVLVTQVLAVAAEHGGSQAEAIDRAAATLRERRALRGERRAQAASARLSTRVMTVLPFAFTGFVAATDADVRHVLVGTPVGWSCLAIGAALNLAGRAWAKRALAA